MMAYSSGYFIRINCLESHQNLFSILYVKVKNTNCVILLFLVGGGDEGGRLCGFLLCVFGFVVVWWFFFSNLPSTVLLLA